MMDKSANYRLLLYAKPGQLDIKDSNTLVEPLAKLGLLGEVIPATGSDYLAGHAFTDLITFLGCAPEIALHPDQGESFCFIRLHEITAELTMYHGENTRTPFCRLCKQDQSAWRDVEKKDYCDQCTLDERSANWAWKKSAALSRLAISVFNIYPHEAVPSQQLLEWLGTHSGQEWGFAYV